MEFREYVSLVARFTPLIVGLTLTFMIVGYVGTIRRPPRFEATTTLTVEKPQATAQSGSLFYQFDEYYSQLAAALFADTIANWLRSPATVVEIYEKAGQVPPVGSAAQVGRTFRVSKAEDTTVITLTVEEVDRATAENIIETAKSVINAKVDELKARNNDPSYFAVAATPAKVFEIKTDPTLTALLGGVTGLIVSLVVAFVLTSLSPWRPRSR